MRKSKYITKYDYIDFYTKQPAFLFHTNDEIISSIDAHIKAINQNDSACEEDEYEENEEIDSLSFYKEMIIDNKNIDKNNPKIVEGIILDNLSKQHVINQYPQINKHYDFDQYSIFDNEKNFSTTMQLLSQNDQIIIFQPTFIYKNMVTRCDALVKIDNQIHLIETKGTSSVKLHHFLDVLFQSVLLSNILQDYDIQYFLCIVDYVLAKKGQCPFVITPNFNYSKTISKSVHFNLEQWRLAKQGFNPTLIDKEHKSYEFFPINLTKIINGDFSDMELKAESSSMPITKTTIKKQIELLTNTINNFKNDIDKLWNIKQQITNLDDGFIKEIRPQYNDNGDFKKPDYWINLRKLYQYQDFTLLKFSGNVVYQTGQYLQQYQKTDDIAAYFKKEYYSLFYDDNNPIVIDYELTHNLLNQIKDKKVYFDFETINIATRVIDNTYPFMQIITQCSIIKSHNNQSFKDLISNNIVIDPLSITIDAFKAVVDALYEGDEVSYIVYNKSFESTRLKELIAYINEPEYTRKIEVIRNNLFDLADFFTIKKEGTPILIKEFGGFYSIKKVLPFIEKNHPDLFILTACLDYKSLPVGNGLDCQSKTTMRFFNRLDEKEWLQLKKDICVYCENDVRAMIAVELLVKKLVNK